MRWNEFKWRVLRYTRVLVRRGFIRSSPGRSGGTECSGCRSLNTLQRRRSQLRGARWTVRSSHRRGEAGGGNSEKIYLKACTPKFCFSTLVVQVCLGRHTEESCWTLLWLELQKEWTSWLIFQQWLQMLQCEDWKKRLWIWLSRNIAKLTQQAGQWSLRWVSSVWAVDWCASWTQWSADPAASGSCGWSSSPPPSSPRPPSWPPGQWRLFCAALVQPRAGFSDQPEKIF